MILVALAVMLLALLVIGLTIMVHHLLRRPERVEKKFEVRIERFYREQSAKGFLRKKYDVHAGLLYRLLVDGMPTGLTCPCDVIEIKGTRVHEAVKKTLLSSWITR